MALPGPDPAGETRSSPDGASEPRPLIGLPLQPDKGSPPRLGLNRAYFEAIERAGGIPLALPLTLWPETAEALLARCHGLVLPGGADVEPSRYGQTPKDGCGVETIPGVDEAETVALNRALEADLPVLAICRGFQLVNVVLGGTLWQDLVTEGATSSDHRAPSRTVLAHGLRVDPNSRLARIIGSEHVGVNTLHHQGLRELAPDLRAVGWSDDGLVEAVELERPTLFIGLQCHPEELAPDHPWAARLFEALVEEARRIRGAHETGALGSPSARAPR